MNQLFGLLSSLPDLLLVILGFGFIIFIHELGHFLAAKWAGIRVLAFAIGFGRPIVCYRKGMGCRWGRSTEPEYRRTLEGDEGRMPHHQLSPTEYRLNWLPLGGYVKMLGQEDLRPDATSRESDSYQSIKPWKRMVVISAGVVMNVILAAILFVIVFMWGLKTEPAIVGGTAPGSPAAITLPENAASLGITEPGLKAGDVVTKVNGRRPAEFTDLVLAAAMSRRDAPVELDIQRQGFPEALRFNVVPRVGDMKLLEMGVAPALSTRVIAIEPGEPDYERAVKLLEKLGLEGVLPGSRLTRVNGAPVQAPMAIREAVRQSGGRPVSLEFELPGGGTVVRDIRPEPELEVMQVTLPSGMVVPTRHILGLTPVMQVAETKSGQGLQSGDIFARLGNARHPSLPEGMAEIHAHKGKQIEVSVLRPGKSGAPELVRIEPSPKVRPVGLGQIGFVPDTTAKLNTLLALPPRGLGVRTSPDAGAEQRDVPAAGVITRPGTRLLSIAGVSVSNFAEIREALRAATADALQSETETAEVPLTLELPLRAQGGGERPIENAVWILPREDVERLHDLGWESPIDLALFEPEQFLLKASNPVEALEMGLGKTHRVMMMTYLTFARLFQGTVKVEHLKGPVGIAQMGTRVAERGPVWLLFFMALISVNLAVINFLPLPIVDGGQFIFLVLEQIRGKPVSVEVQNVATVLGLLLIGTVFIIVTFHDIVNLFG